MTKARSIYAVDVGSPKNGLAWARLREDESTPTGGVDLNVLCTAMVSDLVEGRAVCMGFEAPVFLPVAHEANDLCKARLGERGRPWSAGAGVYVSAVVLPVAAWILERTALGCGAERPRLSFQTEDWAGTAFAQTEPVFLIWEAFVSGRGHAREPNEYGLPEHVQDAATAAVVFKEWSGRDPRPPSHVSTDRALNTVAAAALWAGWDVGTLALHTSALVLWPEECLGAGVRAHDV